MDEKGYIQVVSGRARGVGPWLMRLGLAALEPAYRVGVGWRNRKFDAGQGVVTLDRPVISLGNLTTGGTGKTPLVMWVCRWLAQQGVRPGVLMRGYRKDAAGISDEAAEYAERGLEVEADADRVAGAASLLARQPGVGVFVLDDGFQHRRVKRDLDVVLVDATQPFGFGRVLPRGLLREPMKGLARADAVVVTRADRVSDEQLAELEREVERWHGRPPIAMCRHAWEDVAFAGQRVLVACGIGNPGAFVAQVKQHAEVVHEAVQGDHHPWSTQELDALVAQAQQHDAAIVTTMKDHTKWQHLRKDWPVPIHVPQVAIEFLQGEQAFAGLLQPFVSNTNS